MVRSQHILTSLFLIIGGTACTQTVTPDSGSGGHTAPGTGLAYEEGVPNAIRVVYGEESGTAVEGDKIKDLQDRIDDLENQLANFGGAKYLGDVTTTNPSGGAVFLYQAKYGMLGIVDACSAQYGAGAHPCTMLELQNNFTSGDLTAGAYGWVATGQTAPKGTNYPTLDSLTTTCRGFTYNSADLARGTMYYVENIASKPNGGAGADGSPATIIRFAEVACSLNAPFPCCGSGGGN